jgi:hypothetical protein
MDIEEGTLQLISNLAFAAISGHFLVVMRLGGRISAARFALILLGYSVLSNLPAN